MTQHSRFIVDKHAVCGISGVPDAAAMVFNSLRRQQQLAGMRGIYHHSEIRFNNTIPTPNIPGRGVCVWGGGGGLWDSMNGAAG